MHLLKTSSTKRKSALDRIRPLGLKCNTDVYLEQKQKWQQLQRQQQRR